MFPRSHTHKLYQTQDPDSAAWFLKTKLGGNKEAINGLVAASKTSEWVDNQSAAVRERLATIERLLAANKAAGAGKFLAGTDHPTHADAAVYGWYAASEAVRGYSPSLVDRTWFHESLPHVKQWVQDIAEESKAKPAYPY